MGRHASQSCGAASRTTPRGSELHPTFIVHTRWLFFETPSPAPYFHARNLLWYGFPLLMLFALAGAIGGAKILPSAPQALTRPFFAYLTVTLLWFTVSSNLFEIGENDRMRIEIDAALAVLLGCALCSLYNASVRVVNELRMP